MNELSDPNLGYSALTVSILANVDIDEAFRRLEHFPKEGQLHRQDNRNRDVLSDYETKVMFRMKRVGISYERIGARFGISKYGVFNRLKRLKERETA
jgi:DNA-binding CsgD family transcriptional regulator